MEVPSWPSGRNLKIEYTAGLNKNKTGVWVEEQHAAELNELAAAVQSAMP